MSTARHIPCMFSAPHNVIFLQIVLNIVFCPPRLFTRQLGRFPNTHSAHPYWLRYSSFSSWSYILPNPITTTAKFVRANASTQSLQKLVSSHPYHRLRRRKGTQCSGFTLPLHLRVSHAARQGPYMHAAIPIVRTSIASPGRTSRKSWRIYGKVRRRDWGGSRAFDSFRHS